MSSRQNVFASMLARSEKPFTTRKAPSQPREQGRHGVRSHADDRDESRERRPLGEPRAPEELAQ